MNFQEISKQNAVRLAAIFLANPELVSGYCKETVGFGSTYEESWAPFALSDCSYYEMVGLSGVKTPRYRERHYPCGNKFTGRTKNPELWCFFPHFEEALASLKSEEEERNKYASRMLIPFWAKAA